MKKFIFLLPLLFLLTACPVGLDYTPGKKGSEKINPKLEGTWVFQADETSSDAEALKVTIEKRDNNSFWVEVLEKGEMYSLDVTRFMAYETKIDNLNIIYMESFDEKKYYLYQYKLENNKLIIADIPLKVGGIDAVKSTETLREEIKASMKLDGFFSEAKTYSRK